MRQVTLSNQDGATAIEYAFVCLFLIPFSLCAIWLLYLCYVAASLQYVAAWGLRQAALGPPQVVPAPVVSFALQKRDDIQRAAAGLGIDVSAGDIHVCPIGAGAAPSDADCTVTANTDFAPGQLASVKVQKVMTVPILTNMNLTLTGLALGRIEPYRGS